MRTSTKLALGYLPVAFLSLVFRLDGHHHELDGVSQVPIRFLVLFTTIPYFLLVWLYDWLAHGPGKRWMDKIAREGE